MLEQDGEVEAADVGRAKVSVYLVEYVVGEYTAGQVRATK